MPWIFWFGSAAAGVHTYSFLLYRLETLAVQTSSLFRMASGAVAKASLLCQLQSWLYRLLRSRLKNVGSGWRHKAPPNSQLGRALAADTKGALVQGQCRGSPWSCA